MRVTVKRKRKERSWQENLLVILNRTLNAVIVICLLIVMGYSVYAIWDNNSVYDAALQLHVQLKKIKPDEKKPSFAEVLKINPDTVAWVTMDHTEIDDPIVQGSDNAEYLNKNIYGQFSLAGTLFLDTRCDSSFTDVYSLVYGHHMDRHEMFGDLDLYLDQDFFEKNDSGTLMVPGTTYALTVAACMVVNASDEWVFEPLHVDPDVQGFLRYVSQMSKYQRQDVLTKVSDSPDQYGLLCLSTCSASADEARTIVLAVYERK